ncbi:LacI family DNA-binding transcriptional regulator [Anaerotalea alkaliphila]|uniref:LacI family transcriptional regulator n=1 Tax=Anaerotalea alkaliphila TaxID=2662126 RepID=A0A7X5HU98_9FIRM|nr:LacI family DNA-binding transcriptional regulator [Anaerotalea alkaliphila]NDL66800.1 LacI family transcriptional regulator [Anaerotalea alkaliphila]
MATLKDVARLANVDVSTVSRALNNVSYVHPDTKEKILDAVQQLSYRPNLLAKGLRQGKSHTVGVVIPSINLSVFGEIVQGIEIEARRFGYGVMICNTEDSPESEEECIQRLRNGFVDGIVIASTGKHKRLIRDVKCNGIPVVQLVRKQDETISSIVADYFKSGYEGTKYLIGKGCKQVGLINGPMEIVPYKERYRGYRKAIKEFGYEEHVVESNVPKGDYFKGGYQGVARLLEDCKEIDGVLTSVDMQGIGVIRALKERGIPVPGKIKVMSLTGHSIGGMLETAMTSMEIPAVEMGRGVTQMVIEEIEADPQHKPALQHVVLKVSLVERETT